MGYLYNFKSLLFSRLNIKFKFYLGTAFIISSFCTLLPSQSALTPGSDIKGKIVDDKGAVIGFATVGLLNADSVIVSGEMSLENGNFHITGINPGTYLLMVKHLEFQTVYTDKFSLKANESKTIPVIQLQTSSVNLDEVVVTGRKALIEIQADKLIFNVASSPSASGTNGLELLRKSPGVIVDMDNNISLQGKGGVLVFINGVASRLAGNDLATLLQSINSDNVESIEIIANPSSKYEAEGNAGIINIKLKKNVAFGFNGSLTSSASKGNFYRNNNSIGLNYGAEKVKLSFDINRSEEDIQDDIFMKRKQNGFLLDQVSYEVRSRVSYNVAIGMDYQLNKNHSLSFTGRAIKNQNNNNLNSNTFIGKINSSEPEEVLFSKTIVDQPTYNFNYNLNYRWAVNKTSTFSADLSMGNFSTENYTYQPNTYFASDRTTIKSVIDDEFNANTTINLWSAKADYEKIVG
jgi:iron complex outermembrane recepter protein